MTWTITLTDGVNSVDLNDGSSYRTTFLSAPTPALRASFAGAGNPFRAGRSLSRMPVHENREVRVGVTLMGGTSDGLANLIEDVNAQSRRAHEWSGLGIGTRTQLKLQWDSATNPVYFNVVTASFDAIGEGSHSSFLRVSKTLRDRVLTLECEPYAVGADETISNYARDADFEVAGTALAGWTE